VNIAEAQREMRDVYLNCVPGAIAATLVWTASAAAATWSSPVAGAWTLAIGGAFIFPLSLLILRLLGRPIAPSHANPLMELAPQVAFVVPLIMPLAGAAMLYRTSWFYPAMMVIVGAHYLPFAFLYGRKAFLVLAVAMVAAGFALVFLRVEWFAFGGWLTAGILGAFGVISIPRRQHAIA
jgi:hypothetical protein